MKIRNGYVSNSSSSSFCVFGSAIKEEDILKTAKRLDIIEDENNSSIKDNLGNIIFDIMKVDNCLSGYYEGGLIYFGCSPDLMKEEETKKEFKNRIKERIESLFGISGIKVRFISLVSGG